MIRTIARASDVRRVAVVWEYISRTLGRIDTSYASDV